jgi:hypothetical protein
MVYMNEKLYELFDLARKGAANAKDAAASAAYTANQVGTELLANAKVRMKIVELESQVNAGLRDLGKLLYATHVGTPVASEVMMEKLEEIDRLNAELEVLKGGIAKENPAPSCPTCCAAIQEGDEFCRECGGKL